MSVAQTGQIEPYCQRDFQSQSLREYDTENHTEKPEVTLKIERTKYTSNDENFQWDFKGLTFLDK